MKDKSLFVYIAAFCAILIPAPGRFVYGLALMFELILLVVTGTLATSLVKKIKLEELRSVIIMLILISTTILYRQLYVYLQTEIALTLGFIFFIPPVSIFMIEILFNQDERPLQKKLVNNLIKVLLFSLFGMIMFIFRDIAGYGTLTWFGSNHQIREIILLNPEAVGIFEFFASIPGAFLICGIFMFTFLVVSNKLQIIENAEGKK